MKNNETGEFELVVGNRQLLSGFAIVVLLFGVGVAMGYILGQNSPRSAKLQPETAASASSAAASDSRPQPAAPVPAAAPANDVSAQPAASAEAPAEPAAQAPEPTTKPARDTAAAPSQQPPAAAANAIPEAPPGNYWQVMSLEKSEAEGVAKTLREQGFPALLSPGPKNLTRVLVGPYKDTQSMGKAKTDLEKAGLHPVRRSSE